jgi:cellulose synthase/poly-beta-1,6-N-acetylglucosamine synthase-like glycosyltransferase
MQHVRGKYVIFADADGASKFDDIAKLQTELKLIERDGLGVAVGSRAHMVHSAAVVQVTFPRASELMVAIVHSEFHNACVSYIFAFYRH